MILSSSYEERDRKRASELGVWTYLVKPPDETMMRQLFQSVAENKKPFIDLQPVAPLQWAGNRLVT